MKNKEDNVLFVSMVDHCGQMKLSKADEEIKRLEEITGEEWVKYFTPYLQDDDAGEPHLSKLWDGYCWVVKKTSMDSYYLLTFNEDYADEHDVPALACMNQNEFNEWKEKPLGRINENYDEEKADYEIKQKALEEIHQEIKEKVGKNWPSIQFNKWPKDLYERYQKMETFPRSPSKVNESSLFAWLGNSGEGFEENYRQYAFAKELVEAGIVKITPVNKKFWETFHEANLANLGLCNVFELEV
jgi:hypothetical protein